MQHRSSDVCQERNPFDYSTCLISKPYRLACLVPLPVGTAAGAAVRKLAGVMRRKLSHGDR